MPSSRLSTHGDRALRRLARGRHAAAHVLRQGRPPQGARSRPSPKTLLAAFRAAPLLDAYDIYQHLMDYWAETMQDDAYLIAADGWVAQPARILETDKKGKTKDKGWTCDLDPQAASSSRATSPRSRRARREAGRTGSRRPRASPSWRRSTAARRASSARSTRSPRPRSAPG